MLVTFTTDAYADITMFGDVALATLKMMGHSATVPGAILAADVPAALSRLTAAIDADKTPPPVSDKDAEEPVVSMMGVLRVGVSKAQCWGESWIPWPMLVIDQAGTTMQRRLIED
ncbi:MAG: hypothetical protein A2Z44_09265 [Betaproteobacteria bacterium RBG_19FT_COMBO_58_11]|nr:MAG: hypothetical protein A2Z44_09265 [Betaproteobacteria bacterium RBG_19FT_COMBO_58_11]